jgi:hypothetical protein
MINRFDDWVRWEWDIAEQWLATVSDKNSLRISTGMKSKLPSMTPNILPPLRCLERAFPAMLWQSHCWF